MLFLGGLAALYLMGPTPAPPMYSAELPQVPNGTQAIENYVVAIESQHKIRPESEAKIVWANPEKSKTDIAILYLHGFSATRMEGHPVHQNVADTFGCNIYYARLAAHGQDTFPSLQNCTAENLWESAKEALEITEELGDKVLIVSTSTGSTLALKLAADYPEKVHALINLSPNIRIANPAARLLNDPWGTQIASLVFGDPRYVKHRQKEAEKYWDTAHCIEAIVELENLLETTMTDETFQKVTCPVLTLYYYKDDENQDEVVDVSVIPAMHEALGTPKNLKKHKALSTVGDHVIGSSIKSKDTQVVEKEIIAFCENVLDMELARENVFQNPNAL